MPPSLPHATVAAGARPEPLDRSVAKSIHAEGEEPLIVGVAIDVSEQQGLERQIARFQLTEGLGRMAARIAHHF